MQVKLLWAPAWEPSGMAKLAMLVVYLSLHLFVNLLHYFGIYPSVLSLTASSAMSARSTLCPAQHKTPTHKMGSCVVVDIDLIWLTLLRTLEDNHTGTQDRVVLRQSCKHEHIMVKVLRCGEYCFLQKEPSLSASKALNRSCHILLIAYIKASHLP